MGGCAQPTPEHVADGDDPLAALAVPAETHRYTGSYWREQYLADSAGRPSPWKQALAYCGTTDHRRPGLEAGGAKPNCFPLQQVENATPAHFARERVRQQAALEQLQQKLDAQLREARAGRF